MNRDNIGKVLYNNELHLCQIEDIRTISGKEWYIVNSDYPDEHRGGWDMWDDAELETIENKQEAFKQRIIKNKQREEQERREQEQKARIKAEKENLFGFTDSKTPMQKQKILDCLMKTFYYNGKIMNRKEFIIEKLKQGYTSEIKNFRTQKSDKIKPYNCLFDADHKTFIEVTKTEYDFFNYLKENNIIEQNTDQAAS